MSKAAKKEETAPAVAPEVVEAAPVPTEPAIQTEGSRGKPARNSPSPQIGHASFNATPQAPNKSVS